MKIKTKEHQINERIELNKKLIDWQKFKVKRARKRYKIKDDWVFSFWIWSNSSTLKFVAGREEGILENLEDYTKMLEDSLNEKR